MLMLGCFINGASVATLGGLLLLKWPVKILHILVQVEHRGVDACKYVGDICRLSIRIRK